MGPGYRMTVSEQWLSLLTREASLDRLDPLTNPFTTVAVPTYNGIPIISTPMFPIVLACEKCGETGEGSESTYCPSCDGTGRVVYDGLVSDIVGDTTMLIKGLNHLPKLFEPSFPPNVVALPPICKGLS